MPISTPAVQGIRQVEISAVHVSTDVIISFIVTVGDKTDTTTPSSTEVDDVLQAVVDTLNSSSEWHTPSGTIQYYAMSSLTPTP